MYTAWFNKTVASSHAERIGGVNQPPDGNEKDDGKEKGEVTKSVAALMRARSECLTEKRYQTTWQRIDKK